MDYYKAKYLKPLPRTKTELCHHLRGPSMRLALTNSNTFLKQQPPLF